MKSILRLFFLAARRSSSRPDAPPIVSPLQPSIVTRGQAIVTARPGPRVRDDRRRVAVEELRRSAEAERCRDDGGAAENRAGGRAEGRDPHDRLRAAARVRLCERPADVSQLSRAQHRRSQARRHRSRRHRHRCGRRRRRDDDYRDPIRRAQSRRARARRAEAGRCRCACARRSRGGRRRRDHRSHRAHRGGRRTSSRRGR